MARADQVDRRGELLAHAERLFRERGYRDTRLVDIATEAGVAKSLVYWYFESKEALFLAVVQDMQHKLQQAQADAVRGIDAPLERIYAGTVASVKFVVKNFQLYGLISLAASDPLVSQALRATSSAHARDTISELERGQADGSIRADETPQALAHGNQGVVNHFCTAFVRKQLDGNLTEAGHTAARFVVRAMAATPEHAEAVIRSRANKALVGGT
jgi:AcrR family transcriptional regulator